MSLGENLQYYRKKKEITQEQLAEELGVSRQTISKWESDGSYPEMEKILQLCDLFECSMDLLLRGDAKENATFDTAGYDNHMNQFIKRIMFGLVIVFAGISVMQLLESLRVNDNLTSAILVIILIPAILIFVVAGMQRERFCEKNPVIQLFYTEQEIERFEQRFPILIASGVGIILMSVVFQLISEQLPVPRWCTQDIYMAAFFMIIAVGICIIVYAGMQKEKYDIKKYNKHNNPEKRENTAEKRIGMWCGCIMLAAMAIFLIAGLGFDLWGRCWIVFPVGGILCGIAVLIIEGMTKKD